MASQTIFNEFKNFRSFEVLIHANEHTKYANCDLHINFWNFLLIPFCLMAKKDHFKQKLIHWPQILFNLFVDILPERSNIVLHCRNGKVSAIIPCFHSNGSLFHKFCMSSRVKRMQVLVVIINNFSPCLLKVFSFSTVENNQLS